MKMEEFIERGCWGILASIDVSGCNPDLIRDADAIKRFTAELCDRIEVKPFGDCQVVHFADHNEEVAGYSMVQLIETSLISAHFANKSNAVYLDVFSCKYYDPQIVESYALEFFQGNEAKVTITPRQAP